MDQSAIKNCPYCGEEILAVAIKCKHCGEFLTEQPSNATPNQSGVPESPVQKIEVKAKEGCFMQTLNFGCVMIVLALVVFTLVLVIANQ